MIDRDKVVSRLQIIRTWAEVGKNYNGIQGEGCLRDTVNWIDDAIVLLKEQEPRVLELEELKQFVGHPCWFESSGTYMGKEGFWIIPSMFKMFCGGETVFYVSVLMKNSDCGMTYHGELGLSVYNKVWRCWSSRPTDEQREVEPWES